MVPKVHFVDDNCYQNNIFPLPLLLEKWGAGTEETNGRKALLICVNKWSTEGIQVCESCEYLLLLLITDNSVIRIYCTLNIYVGQSQFRGALAKNK